MADHVQLVKVPTSTRSSTATKEQSTTSATCSVRSSISEQPGDRRSRDLADDDRRHAVRMVRAGGGVGARAKGRLLGMYGDHYLGMEYQVPDVPRRTGGHGGEGRPHPARRRSASSSRIPRTASASRGRSSTATSSTLTTTDRVDADEDAHRRVLEHRAPVGDHGTARAGARRSTTSTRRPASTRISWVRRCSTGKRDRTRWRRRPGWPAGDTVMELISPTGDGPVQRYLDRYEQHMRATTFSVQSMDRVEDYFTERGIALVDGDVPGTGRSQPDRITASCSNSRSDRWPRQDGADERPRLGVRT